jgi:hypothetical protein
MKVYNDISLMERSILFETDSLNPFDFLNLAIRSFAGLNQDPLDKASLSDNFFFFFLIINTLNALLKDAMGIQNYLGAKYQMKKAPEYSEAFSNLIFQ